MKHPIKKIPITCAAALCAVALAVPSARANSVNGSISFGAEGVVVNNPNLADATSFYVDGTVAGLTVKNLGYVAMDPVGTYSSVPLLTPVTFNGFTFNPAAASVTPLWTFTLGSPGDQTVYSFDATSVVADWNAGRSEWDIGGTGLAMATGYTTTAGSWTVNLSQTDASFAFDATSGASGRSVPDGGSSMAYLGCAFLGLGAFGRKLHC